MASSNRVGEEEGKNFLLWVTSVLGNTLKPITSWAREHTQCSDLCNCLSGNPWQHQHAICHRSVTGFPHLSIQCGVSSAPQSVFKEVSSAHQVCIYLIKNARKTVILWNIITIQNNCFLFVYIVKCHFFLWCKAEFSASLLQSSVSHDPSEIILIYWFAGQETFLIIIIKNTCAA